jgi:hypothetical protein
LGWGQTCKHGRRPREEHTGMQGGRHTHFKTESR